MRPTLFEIDLPGVHITAGSYRTMLILAAIATVVLLVEVARRRDLPWRRVLAFALVTALAVPIGARLLHAATNAALYAEEPSLLWQLSFTNYALYGGLVLAAVTGVIAARALGLDLWRVADAAAPALGAGIVLVRSGCFLNGCCFGQPCDSAYGVVYPALSGPHFSQIAQGRSDLFGSPLPVYPTQLLELGGALLGVVIAVALMRRGAPDGVAFLSLVATFTATRWAVRPLRVIPETYATGELFYTIAYATIIAACLALIAWRLRRARATE